MVTSPAAADAALPYASSLCSSSIDTPNTNSHLNRPRSRLNNFETARFLHAVITDPLANTPEQNVWAKLKRYQYSLFALQTFGFPVSPVPFLVCRFAAVMKVD